MKEEYIFRTDELDNAIDYLKKAVYYYNHREESHWFKWLMISLHGALYGFGVCAIQGTSPSLRVFEEPKGKQLRQILDLLSERYLDKDTVFSNDHDPANVEEHMQILKNTLAKNNLDKIWDILDKCENPDFMMQFSNSKVLKRSQSQIEAIQKMVDYRNDFAHFKPKGLSIMIESEEWLIQEVVGVIKFLALESGNISYTENNTKERVENLIKKFQNSNPLNDIGMEV